MNFARMETSDDAALGGRLRLRQPLRGHRFGHDAILLAAATGSRSGEHAVDLGAGVGAAGLALAVRVPGLKVTLADIDEGLCALANDNAQRNGLADRVRAVALDVTDPHAFAAAGLPPGCADRVLMNPPFNDRSHLSPDARRRLAHAGTADTLPRWVEAAARLLKPQGVLTLIWRADGIDDVLGALAADFGGVTVLAVHPRPGAAAIRVLMRASKGVAAPVSYVAAITLNDSSGQPTAPAEAVLREGCTLALAEI